MRFLVNITFTKSEIVKADYFRIEGGCLIFRNQRKNPYLYPETLKVYASGSWQTVELIRETSWGL